MGALLLGGLTGMLYGVSDLLGGVAARRADSLAVTVVSHLAGAVVLLLVALALPGTRSLPDAAWGAAAGTAGAGGCLFYYRALSAAPMGQVAPLTMTSATAVPVVVAIVLGQVPSPTAAGGIAVALLAIVLVSRPAAGSRYQPRHLHQPPFRVVLSPAPVAGPSATATFNASAARHRVMGTALLAGVLLGAFYGLLQPASGNAGLWPLLWARVGALLLLAGAVPRGAHRQPLWPRRSALLTALAAGGLEAVANAAYLLALHLAWQHGTLGAVAVLAALTPIWTAALAWRWLREHLGSLQVVGLGLAIMAIVLITVG